MNDNFEDNFLRDREEPAEQVHEETPQEREEREIAENTIERRHNTVRLLLAAAIVVMLLSLLWTIYSHFYRPVERGIEYGWVMRLVDEGSLMSTYEGELLSERFAADTIVLEDVFRFTVADDSLCRMLKHLEAGGHRIGLHYKRYAGTLPWRGASHAIGDSINLTPPPADTTRITRRAAYPH